MSGDAETMKRVLSIQSHVVSGYVGNKSASFPLQLLGFEVDTINSVQFSNHTGYPVFKGQVLNATELGDLYDGLKANKLNRYSHLLTGYIGSLSFLEKVSEVIKDLKAANASLIYVCDPVMGDNAKMYVPAELLPVYRDQVLCLADIITPNQYEAELLTGMKIVDEASARAVLNRLHELGPHTVVMSSSNLGSDDILVGMASSKTNGCFTGVRFEMPLLPAIFTGTGDLFASLLLAWLTKHPHSLQLAVEKTVSTIHHVIKRTFAAAQQVHNDLPRPHNLELKLVQSKRDIEEPSICIHCTPL